MMWVRRVGVRKEGKEVELQEMREGQEKKCSGESQEKDNGCRKGREEGKGRSNWQ